jgi:hypothetical protein
VVGIGQQANLERRALVWRRKKKEKEKEKKIQSPSFISTCEREEKKKKRMDHLWIVA